jgi:uncharacterized membrane protein
VRVPDFGSKRPLTMAQEAALVAAIRDAERGNRGEVRLHVERRCPGGDALKRARQIFHLLGMSGTRDDTAVLLYVALSDRKAAVFAGNGIHGAADEDFWRSVVDVVAQGYKRGAGEASLVIALGRIGDMLRQHVPGEDRAGNELPDEVTTS